MVVSSTRIKRYLESDKRDFKVFKVKLSHVDVKAINELDIERTAEFNYYGKLKELDFQGFFKTVGKNRDTQSVENTIKKIIKKVLGGFGRKYFWLAVRASTPTKDFDIPRWHYDGKYFKSTDSQAKFAVTLKGPGTLVVRKSTAVEKAYNAVASRQSQEVTSQLDKRKSLEEQLDMYFRVEKKYRLIFAEAMEKFAVTQLGNDEGIIFWGGKDTHYSALHSEPKVDKPRLFVSVLPSSKENILSLRNRSR